MMFKKTLLATALIAASGFTMTAAAAPSTASGTFLVQMTILKSCGVTTTNTIQLGAAAGVASNDTTAADLQGNANLVVTCSKTTPYNIGLLPSAANGGTANGTGAMATADALAGNTDKPPYTLYQNSGYSTVWGNTIGTNTLTAANGLANGTGSAQTYVIYAQATSANYTPDSYKDTVAVTVTY